MRRLRLAATLLACTTLTILIVTPLAGAQSAQSSAGAASDYVVPRTEDGQPDFRGVWIDEFLTPLERPAGIPAALPAQGAAGMVAAIKAELAGVGVICPDVFTHDISALTKVRGEYRTSVIVDPPDGQLPYNEFGAEEVARFAKRDEEAFDRADQRPLVERCMESFGYPPMRAIPVMVPRQFFQNRDHLVILTEDAVGLRVIRLEGEAPPAALRSVEGSSIGHWEGDTLVVETTNLRALDPPRFGAQRQMLLSPDARIEERFTRVSDTELVYRYTVSDDTYYTRPWTGEFSLKSDDGSIYEYACHEGNYSMPHSLSGGRAVDAEPEASSSTVPGAE